MGVWAGRLKRAALAALIPTLLLAGCSGSSRSSSDAARVSAAQVTLTPGDGASEVPGQGGVFARVRDGRLTEVHLKDADGDEVPGAITPDGSSWSPSGRLLPETTYTLDALAVDKDGLQAAKHASFTTFVPKNTFIGFYNPVNRSTVGVGFIVEIRFNRAIRNRAAVQAGISVTAQPPVPVAPHWFGDQRIDFRPQHYWTPGTKVTLALDLKHVEAAPGVYGTQAKSIGFTIGRSQISTADTDADTLTVVRGGQTLRTLDISAGAPGHETYEGVMVISERDKVTRMDSHTVGLGSEYDIPAVPHAQRLTDSGTFVHGVYWRPASVFGRQNTSHGCIGLYDVAGGGSTTTAAGWFFAHSMIGDVVRVVGSDGDEVAPDNGMSGWNLSWAEWTAGSAAR
ncbi:L,D-transpeptidase [Streptacidiphilus neutrinimicus]|uniref:L,D-transpeptidase n=1 Tax=Streptacidiphilus neutrinimicus TaxID=105420 RepID=UPI000AC4D207|nr:Ig-like domain-containing protein [Streptacidiphilus neutrinimicus]